MRESLIRYFNHKGWQFDSISEGAFLIPINHEGIKFNLIVDFILREERISVYSIFQPKIRVDKRSQIAELITRINYGLNVGNFEFDYTDGDLRFKTSFFFQDIALTDKILDNLILSNVWCFTLTNPTLNNVLSDLQTPEEAYSQLMKQV